MCNYSKIVFFHIQFHIFIMNRKQYNCIFKQAKVFICMLHQYLAKQRHRAQIAPTFSEELNTTVRLECKGFQLKLLAFAKVATDFHLPLAVAGVYSLLIKDQRKRERGRAHTHTDIRL